MLMGIITNMRNRMQVVMWTILVLFIISMAIGGLVGGASIGDIFGQQNGNHIGSLNGKPILYEDFKNSVNSWSTIVCQGLIPFNSISDLSHCS